ncbi:MAG: hypothetical protein JST20_00560 [Bacteroidetes bacterium]|nr:hypothetical protein [Bacteroidota bacterium]
MKTLTLSVLLFAFVFSTLPAQVVGTPSAFSPIDSTQKPITQQIEQPKSKEATLHSGINFGIGFGYGFKAGYDFGVNIRAGISTDSRLYLGGLFNYNFGRSLKHTFDTNSISLETFGYSIAGELGYDLLVEKQAILRPSVAVGVISFREISDIKVGAITESRDEITSHLLISPGMLLQFPITKDIFWGAELRYNVVTGDGDFNAFALHTNFLFRF